MQRQSVGHSSKLEREIGFSRAVRAGPYIAVSGTAPIDEHGQTVCIDDLYGQTRACLRKGIQAIEALGASADNIIRTRIMITDISSWREAAKAHGDLFKEIAPACTFVEVKGFIGPDWLVETEIDAVVDRHR